MKTAFFNSSNKKKIFALFFIATFFTVQMPVAKVNTAHADSQEPYLGTPHAIPGRIEAEDYDTGGEGDAYHDTASDNDPGEYRADDVDIERTYDGGGRTDYFRVPFSQYGDAGEYIYVKNGLRDEFWVMADNEVNTFVRMDPETGDILGVLDFAPWGNPVKVDYLSGMAYSPADHKVYVNVQEYSGSGYGMLAIDVPSSPSVTPTIDYTIGYPTTVYNYGGIPGVWQGVYGGDLQVNPVDGTVWLEKSNTLYLLDKQQHLFLWAFAGLGSAQITYDGTGNMYVSGFYGNDPIWMVAPGDTSGNMNDIGYIATQIANNLSETTFSYTPAFDSNRNVLWLTGGNTQNVWPFDVNQRTFGQPITVPEFYSYDYGYDHINDSMFGQIDPYGGTGSEVWGYSLTDQEEFVRYILNGFWSYSGPRTNLYGAGKYAWIDGWSDSGDGYAIARMGPGNDVTHTKDGEWLEYSVDVEKTDDYTFSIRQATDSSTGQFRLLVDGAAVSGWTTFDSAGAQDWQTLDGGVVNLSAGTHTLRLEFNQTTGNGDVGNVNWIEFQPYIPAVSTSVTTTNTGNGLGQAIGADGFSRFVYLDGDNQLTYARCTDVNCVSPVTSVVETGTGELHPGGYVIALGQDGFGRIAYTKSDDSLWMYTCLDNDCSMTSSHQIAAGTKKPGAYGTEITMGLDGFPRIAYSDGSSGYANHFVLCLDTSCSSVVDTVVGGANTYGYAVISLTMGPDGFARIVYPQSGNTVEYARCTNADCSTSVIASVVSDPGNDPGMQGVVVRTGSDGYSRIAYQNDDGTMHYVTCSDANCTAPSDVTIATQAAPTENGFGLALRDGDLASIAFSGSSDKYLHLLECTDDTCSTSDNFSVDTEYNGGANYATAAGVSLVVGDNDFPRALYSDGISGVRYTRFGADTPAITTASATDLTSTSATLNSTLLNDGGETPTVELKWGTASGSYPNSCTPVINVGDAYSCDLSGLSAGTTYYFKAFAINSGGTGTGEEKSFQTSSPATVCNQVAFPSSGSNVTYTAKSSWLKTWDNPNNITAEDGAIASAYFDADQYNYSDYLIGNYTGDRFASMSDADVLSDYTITVRAKADVPGNYDLEIGIFDGDPDVNGTNGRAWYWVEGVPLTTEFTEFTATKSQLVEDIVGGSDLTGEFLKSGNFKITFDLWTGIPSTVSVDSISICSNDFEFGNEIAVPTINTSAVTNLNSTSATLNATLTDDGGETPTVELKWGTESGSYPNACTPVTNVGSAYSCDLTGLDPNLTYFFKAFATNSAGTGEGSETSFQPTSANSVKKSVDIGDKECKPKDLKVKLLPNGKIKLSWKKPCSVIDKIEIERKVDKEKFEKIATVKKDKHTYEDDGLKLSAGKYTYRIRGYRKASGEHSDYSDTESVTIIQRGKSAVTKPDEPAQIPPLVVEASQHQIERHASELDDTPSAIVSQPDSPTPSVLGEAVEATRRFVQRFAAGFAALALAELAAGVAMVTSPTAIPLFATTPAPFGEFASRLLGMLGFVGKKKREDGWGIVFDSETRRPVSGASVSIINQEGHVVDTSLSDSHGRYGFLPNPGTYTLVISKKDYELETSDRQDILYGDLYAGQAIEVKENEIIKINISLKSTTIDWQDFARRKIASYTSVFSIVKRDAFLILFYAGFVINAGIAYLFPTPLNIAFFVAYLGMVVYYIFFKKRAYGLVTNSQTRQPVPFAMLSVYDATNSQKRVAFSVSDVLGRYFILVENGEYLLKASGNFLGGAHFEKAERIRITDGIVRSDVSV